MTLFDAAALLSASSPLQVRTADTPSEEDFSFATAWADADATPVSKPPATIGDGTFESTTPTEAPDAKLANDSPVTVEVDLKTVVEGVPTNVSEVPDEPNTDVDLIEKPALHVDMPPKQSNSIDTVTADTMKSGPQLPSYESARLDGAQGANPEGAGVNVIKRGGGQTVEALPADTSNRLIPQLPLASPAQPVTPVEADRSTGRNEEPPKAILQTFSGLKEPHAPAVVASIRPSQMTLTDDIESSLTVVKNQDTSKLQTLSSGSLPVQSTGGPKQPNPERVGENGVAPARLDLRGATHGSSVVDWSTNAPTLAEKPSLFSDIPKVDLPIERMDRRALTEHAPAPLTVQPLSKSESAAVLRAQPVATDRLEAAPPQPQDGTVRAEVEGVRQPKSEQAAKSGEYSVMESIKPPPPHALFEMGTRSASSLAEGLFYSLEAEGAKVGTAFSPTQSTAGAAPSVTSNSSPTAQLIASQIAAAVTQMSAGTTQIALNPEELGRVRITLSPSDAGMAVSILTERPETADLMRRHIDALAADFGELGHQNVSFSFEGSGGSSAGDDANERVEAMDLEPTHTDETLLPPTMILRGGLDLKL